MKKFLFSLAFLFLLLGAVLIYQNAVFSDKKLHIVVCNVGQGDAIFIRTPNDSDILIDSGPDASVIDCLSRHMPLWDRTIELAILTHPDADHISGLIDVIKQYKIDNFYTSEVSKDTLVYKEFIKELKEFNIKENYIWQGEDIVFQDGLSMKTLWPTSSLAQENNQSGGKIATNLFSVTELLSYKKFHALFTGDLDSKTEEGIGLGAGKIDLLKVAHHGSRFGTSLKFLDEINPRLAAISVGSKNRYGHPADSTLSFLREKNIKTLRTDQDGEIEIVSDGNSYWIKN